MHKTALGSVLLCSFHRRHLFSSLPLFTLSHYDSSLVHRTDTLMEYEISAFLNFVIWSLLIEKQLRREGFFCNTAVNLSTQKQIGYFLKETN